MIRSVPHAPTPRACAVAVLIPALRPDAALETLLHELRTYGLGCFVLVDDGSGSAWDARFAALAASGVTVLRHMRNEGKGRALRTGFAHIHERMPAIDVVVTADADGQHTPEAILRVVAITCAHASRAVLGRRALPGNAPLRSRFGNGVTRLLFAWLTGHRLQDTQSGLRGFPRALLPTLLALPGDRYEYETAVLVHLCRSGHAPFELPIETLYLDGNRGSHFRPVRDSLRVIRLLLRLGLRG